VRVLFWGTPEFSTPPLRALLGEGFDVVGVVTQPDKPVGRSRSTLGVPPVKRIALEEGIPVLQPERPRGDEFLGRLRALAPDVSVVVAYGHILPKPVLDLPALGSLNVHASLLPALRGAAPIQAAILEGLRQTGVTVMRMVPALDAGPMLLQRATPIVEDETYGELQLRLSELGAEAIVEALALIDVGVTREEEQDESQSSYAPKIERATSRIDWTASAHAVSRQIRAFDPKPGAFTTHRGTDVKLFGARLAPGLRSARPGTVAEITRDGMTVDCGEGAIRISAVQPAGKKRITASEWLGGRGVGIGDVLGA
jgi:methionyl-tRNA formyltransferase